MSKTITVSDEVYRMLEREKGDRSFSEVIRDTLETRGRLADVTEAKLLDAETYGQVTNDVERLSDRTLRGVDDETT